MVVIFGEEIREIYCSLSDSFLLCLPFFLLVLLLIRDISVIVRLVIRMSFFTMMCRAYTQCPASIVSHFHHNEFNKNISLLLRMECKRWAKKKKKANGMLVKKSHNKSYLLIIIVPKYLAKYNLYCFWWQIQHGHLLRLECKKAEKHIVEGEKYSQLNV